MFDDKKESNENRFIIFFDKKTQTIPAFTDIINNKPDGNKSGSITIYPNPVKDKTINIQYTKIPVGRYYLQLISNTRQIMYNNQVILNQHEGIRVIKLHKKLASGNYQLLISCENGKKYKQQIIL